MNSNRYETSIIPIIRKAGKIINYNFRFSRKVVKKGYANYVTDLDKKIEKFIISEIARIYPDSVFVSEEDAKFTSSLSYWVLDPIDGTTNLLHGYKSVCISLAHIQDGEVDFGIVHCPNTHEIFYAQKGKGAYLLNGKNERRIFVNADTSLEGSIVGFGCPYDKKRISFLMKVLEPILEICDDIKRVGPASLDICYVACGRLSAYMELDLEIWDFLAGALILKEAGGQVCDFTGKNDLNSKTDIIASNLHLDHEILQIVNKVI